MGATVPRCPWMDPIRELRETLPGARETCPGPVGETGETSTRGGGARISPGARVICSGEPTPDRVGSPLTGDGLRLASSARHLSLAGFGQQAAAAELIQDAVDGRLTLAGTGVGAVLEIAPGQSRDVQPGEFPDGDLVVAQPFDQLAGDIGVAKVRFSVTPEQAVDDVRIARCEAAFEFAPEHGPILFNFREPSPNGVNG